jgi:hypothetical protein
MANPSLDRLFEKHIPSALREADHSDFVDEVFLNLAHRIIDEFWTENKSNFFRHSTHKLELERTFETNSKTGRSDKDLSRLLKALLAAEVEIRIEPQMTIEQRKKLGAMFQQIAIGFLLCKWHGHAKFCFSRGAQLFGDLRLYKLEDECWYHEKHAAMTQATGWARWKALPLYLFAGFGYRPYRLLYFSVSTVAFFSLIYALLQPSWSLFQCITISSMNYLMALGYGDIRDTAPLTQTIVILQGFLSLVLNSTLFALLVRKWFRL